MVVLTRWSKHSGASMAHGSNEEQDGVRYVELSIICAAIAFAVVRRIFFTEMLHFVYFTNVRVV